MCLSSDAKPRDSSPWNAARPALSRYESAASHHASTNLLLTLPLPSLSSSTGDRAPNGGMRVWAATRREKNVCCSLQTLVLPWVPGQQGESACSAAPCSFPLARPCAAGVASTAPILGLTPKKECACLNFHPTHDPLFLFFFSLFSPFPQQVHSTRGAGPPCKMGRGRPNAATILDNIQQQQHHHRHSHPQ